MNGQAAKLIRFRVYAPAAIAGIGNLPDTIMDRAVVVRMRRRAPDERVRDYRERTTRPEGDALRELLAKWAADVADWVGDPWPQMPRRRGRPARPTCGNRCSWSPTSRAATGRGGPPKRAPRSSPARGTTPPASARGCSPTCGTCSASADALFTQTILDKLHALDESPWADWSYGKPFTARDLADLLKQHQVKSRQLRIGEDSRKGYRRADLEDSWARYLPPP